MTISRTFTDEVPAATRLRQVLRHADERDEIERRVERAPEEAFAPDRRAQREERERRANPRHRPHEPSRHPAARVPAEVLRESHTGRISKPHSANG